MGGRELKVRAEGQLVFNGIFQVLDAICRRISRSPDLAKGRLRRVLEE
jgi:hypothetical protein